MTQTRRARFLDLLASGNSVTTGAEFIGVSRQALYHLRDSNDEFKGAWDDAIDAATDRLEDEARRRALDGSDRLLVFLLRARRPEQYRERYDVTTAGQALVKAYIGVDVERV